MGRLKRWWWRVVFFLVLIVPGGVRVALEGEWWWIAPTIIGAIGLVWLMWDDHRERRAEQREGDRRHRHMRRVMRSLLEDRFEGDPDAEQQINRLMAEYEAKIGGKADLGEFRVNARLVLESPKPHDDADEDCPPSLSAST